MVTSREILESTYRSSRMKKIRKNVIITQVVLTIALLILFTLFSSKASFSPLYLPFEAYILIIFIMILISNVEGVFFKLIGIRWAKTESEKYLLTRSHIKTAIILATAAILVVGAVNFLAPPIDEGMDKSATVVFEGQYNITFQGQDSFALTGVKRVSVSSVDQVPLNVYILRKVDLENGLFDNRFNSGEFESKGIVNMTYKRDDFFPQDDYVIFMECLSSPAKVTYSISRSLSETFIPMFLFFPLILFCLNIAWIVYLIPQKTKFKKTSIYE